MSLFAQTEKANFTRAMPLAARMRPVTLDEFAGQSHFLGEGKLLRRLLHVLDGGAQVASADIDVYPACQARAFSLLIIGGPSVMVMRATSASRICAPRSVTIGRLRMRSNESRISRG